MGGATQAVGGGYTAISTLLLGVCVWGGEACVGRGVLVGTHMGGEYMSG